MKKLIPVLLLVAACGGDDSTDHPDAHVVVDAPAHPDGRPDAAGTPDASPPDSALPLQREGIVIVAEQTDPSGTHSTVGVTLSDGLLFGGPSAVVGACNVYLGVPDAGLSAGDISVTGTTVPVTAVPDSPTPPVSYDAGTTPNNLFTAGATINIAAAGQTGGVPAFSGSVTAPRHLLAVTLPAAVSHASPPILTWTAGTADEVWAWVIGVNGGSADLLWCRGPDTGSFEVPAAALDLVPATDTTGLVVLWRTNATTVTVPSGDMDVALTSADSRGTGAIQIGP